MRLDLDSERISLRPKFQKKLDLDLDLKKNSDLDLDSGKID